MINKVTGLEEAVKDIFDGAVILVGGFGGPGAPLNLVAAISELTLERNIQNLTLVVNAPSSSLFTWTNVKSVKKMIGSFLVPPYSTWRMPPLQEAILNGEIEIETIPQGTMVERIRAAGAGMPAFYTPVGVGTMVEKGKEKRTFGGREYLLEFALGGDFALIKGDKADRSGNLTYRMSQRNFNPVMATAARVTIAEVDTIVDKIDPEAVDTPGIFVDRVVEVPKQILEFRSVMRR